MFILIFQFQNFFVQFLNDNYTISLRGYILKDCLTSLYAHQLEETMKGLIHVQIGHIYI